MDVALYSFLVKVGLRSDVFVTSVESMLPQFMPGYGYGQRGSMDAGTAGWLLVVVGFSLVFDVNEDDDDDDDDFAASALDTGTTRLGLTIVGSKSVTTVFASVSVLSALSSLSNTALLTSISASKVRVANVVRIPRASFLCREINVMIPTLSTYPLRSYVTSPLL